MPRQDGVDDLWDDGLVVADDAGEERRAGLQVADQVVADFVFNGTVGEAPGVDGGAQLTKGRGESHASSYRDRPAAGSEDPALRGTGALILPDVLSPFFDGRPLAIAHRGGAALRPENTMAAFDHAVELGVDAIELDVRLSRDAEVVVIHDATLDRTTDARGPVAALTAAELARVDAGHRFQVDGRFPHRGVGIARLVDVLDRFRDLPFIVELKGESPELASRTVRCFARQAPPTAS